MKWLRYIGRGTGNINPIKKLFVCKQSAFSRMKLLILKHTTVTKRPYWVIIFCFEIRFHFQRLSKEVYKPRTLQCLVNDFKVWLIKMAFNALNSDSHLTSPSVKLAISTGKSIFLNVSLCMFALISSATRQSLIKFHA